MIRIRRGVVMVFALAGLLASLPAAASALSFVPAAGSPITIPAPDDQVTGMTTGYLNDDDRADIVTVSFSNKINVKLGQADGTFTTATGSPFGTGSPVVDRAAIQTEDLNGDGDSDLLVGELFGNDFETYLGDGTGSFPANPDFTFAVPAPPSPFSFSPSTSMGDLDDNGTPDMVIGMEAHKIAVALGNGDGSFSLPTVIDIPTPNNDHNDDIWSTTIGYFDGDPGKDIAMVMRPPDGQLSQVLLASGNGSGSFAPFSGNPLLSSTDTFISVRAVDLNNDSYDDLSVTQPDNTTNSLRTILGSVDGPVINPSPEGALNPGPTGSYPTQQAIGSLDNSGPADIVPLLQGSTQVAAVMNDEDGVADLSLDEGSPFDLPEFGGLPFFGFLVATADFNGDGYNDIAASSSSPDALPTFASRGTDVLLNSGHGTVTPDRVDFPDTEPGGEVSQAVTLQNTAAPDLDIDSITLETGGPGSPFSVNSIGCSGSLVNTQSCSITTRFEPDIPGDYEDNVVISYDNGVPDTLVPLTGTATPPAKAKLQISLSVPKKVKAGRILVVKATVKNTGTATARSIQLKTTVPGKLTMKPKTVKVSSLAAGKSVTKKIKVRVRKGAKKGKELKVKVTASAAGTAAKSASKTAKIN